MDERPFSLAELDGLLISDADIERLDRVKLRSPAQRAKARRQRRWRARQRRCEQVVPVLVSHAIVGTLLDLGWLAERDGEDRARIGGAIAKLLDDLASGRDANKM